jgi:hypothetical protein
LAESEVPKIKVFKSHPPPENRTRNPRQKAKLSIFPDCLSGGEPTAAPHFWKYNTDFGRPQLYLEKFWSTEAALTLAVLLVTIGGGISATAGLAGPGDSASPEFLTLHHRRHPQPDGGEKPRPRNDHTCALDRASHTPPGRFISKSRTLLKRDA